MSLEQRVCKMERELFHTDDYRVVRGCPEGHSLEPIPDEASGLVIIVRDFIQPCRCSLGAQ